VLGEAPEELLTAIVADIVASNGVAVDAIEIVSAEAVVWSDGSLGCARPDEVYPQAPISGYRILLSAGAQRYDYRAAESGFFKRCPQPAPGLPR
jgi:hypothetical protein